MKSYSYVEHFTTRTNYDGPLRFGLSGVHCNIPRALHCMLAPMIELAWHLLTFGTMTYLLNDKNHKQQNNKIINNNILFVNNQFRNFIWNCLLLQGKSKSCRSAIDGTTSTLESALFSFCSYITSNSLMIHNTVPPPTVHKEHKCV